MEQRQLLYEFFHTNRSFLDQKTSEFVFFKRDQPSAQEVVRDADMEKFRSQLRIRLTFAIMFCAFEIKSDMS